MVEPQLKSLDPFHIGYNTVLCSYFFFFSPEYCVFKATLKIVTLGYVQAILWLFILASEKVIWN